TENKPSILPSRDFLSVHTLSNLEPCLIQPYLHSSFQDSHACITRNPHRSFQSSNLLHIFITITVHIKAGAKHLHFTTLWHLHTKRFAQILRYLEKGLTLELHHALVPRERGGI